MAARQLFSSNIAAVLTMIGVSVGLGNVWRFPYMMGLYGGSAFLLIYLFFTFFLAVPAVVAEWSLGRISRQGPIGAFSQAINPRVGLAIGYVLLFTVTVADSYYIVVIGQVLTTVSFSALFGFDENTINDYQALLNSGSIQFAISIFILVVSIYVIHLGLNRGIERISKYIVPFFLILMLYLIIHAAININAVEHLQRFLKPDFDKITPTVAFAAMGQAFFSLGLGGTFLLIYGSYLRSDQDIVKGAVMTGLGDVGAALLSGLFIVPAVFAYNLNLSAGPNLIFNTLPELFAHMPMGRIVGTLFLLGLALVAFLSNIAALEVVAGGLGDHTRIKWSRKQIILGLGVVEAIIIAPSALYPEIIGILDLIFGSGMQTLGSGLSVLALCWGIGKLRSTTQFFPKDPHHPMAGIIFQWLKWVIPLSLVLTLIIYITDSFIK